MGSNKENSVFDDLCQKYETWIIQYNSPKFERPVYMVWLTDSSDDSIDKLILNESNQIIASTDLLKLLQYLEQSDHDLPDAENTRKWLLRSIGIHLFPAATYNVGGIKEGTETGHTTHQWFSEITNFINLFRDYGHQLENEEVLAISKAPELDKVWHSYYEEIFWPEFDLDEKSSKDTFFIYQTDFAQLSIELEQMIKLFENNVEMIEDRK